MHTVKIQKLTQLKPAQTKELNTLILQLNSVRKKELTFEELKKVIEAPANTVFVAVSENEKIVGTVLLNVAHLYVGLRGFLENLVVDSKWRGKGIARQLVQAVVEEAKEAGVTSLKLTTGQGNTAANALYTSFEFEPWTVNTYVLKLK